MLFFDKALNIRILTLSDEAKARKLPKYDWPEKLVYVTPGSHRIFTKLLWKAKKSSFFNREDDFHHVFVRPKSLVGSPGSVWASETVRLRHEDPSAFEVQGRPECPDYSPRLRKCCARLYDLFLYQDMSEHDDLNKVTED